MFIIIATLLIAPTSTDPLIGYAGLIIALTGLVLSLFNYWQANRPKIKVEHSIDYPDYYNEEEYSRLVVTYVRGSVPIAFDVAAFFTIRHGWEPQAIFPPRSPDIANRTLIIKYAHESLYSGIIGCAVRSLNGKWYYSESLKRKYKKMDFEPELEVEIDPNNSLPF